MRKLGFFGCGNMARTVAASLSIAALSLIALLTNLDSPLLVGA